MNAETEEEVKESILKLILNIFIHVSEKGKVCFENISSSFYTILLTTSFTFSLLAIYFREIIYSVYYRAGQRNKKFLRSLAIFSYRYSLLVSLG